MAITAAPKLFDHARALGLTVKPRGDCLTVRPAGKVPAALAGLFREPKLALLEWLLAARRLAFADEANTKRLTRLAAAEEFCLRGEHLIPSDPNQ